MDSSNHDKDRSSVAMTREQWEQWINFQKPEEEPDPMWPSDEFETYDRELVRANSEEIFERISESPILRERFFRWPLITQVNIVKTLTTSWNPIPLGIRYALREKLQTLHPEQMDWMRSDYRDVMMFGPVDITGPQSDEFEYVHTEFADFQNTAPIPRADPATVNETPCLLVCLYGYERVTEAMEMWTGNSSTKKLEHFVELVERWDDFEYPREWILNLMD